MPLQWFHTWFNSPYYHLLYNKRNDEEARHFINNLCSYLPQQSGSKLLDIACGRGRHAIYLNKNGYNVTGIDLSIANIQYARQFESESLHFYVHDMRQLFYRNYFDVAFNLFTSFGYFETDYEHIDALKAFNKALKPGGLLVLDFFNSRKVIDTLVPDSIKTVNGIDFNIHKEIKKQKIIKTIAFEDKGENYTFNEMVSAFTMTDFERFFYASDFEITDTFGSYSLEQFDINNSDRLIFICKKNNA
ncbi:SAM-dependent methyltransferase [Mucilaginibacter sp.]|uniref:SAM-dependent methyltransferase n=1 Tax=Mucilaginibacter sp. TaxID=1882438 RepID=UPI003D0CC2C1